MRWVSAALSEVSVLSASSPIYVYDDHDKDSDSGYLFGFGLSMKTIPNEVTASSRL